MPNEDFDYEISDDDPAVSLFRGAVALVFCSIGVALAVTVGVFWLVMS